MKKTRERKKGTQMQREKMAMNKYLSIITLNVNPLNAPIKSHRVAEWIRKHDSHICCLQETHQEQKTYTDWKWRVGKKYLRQMHRKKKAGVAILISDKIDFKTKAITRNKEGH